MSKDLTEDMQYAKQLYLYGDGKDKPIKNIAKLATTAGVSERGIRYHLADWRRISTELALNNPNSPYSLSLSEDTLEQHRKEIAFLGQQVAKLRTQLAELTPDTQNYHVVLTSYERALTKWEKSTGIMAHHDTVTVGMRERIKAQVKAESKKPELPFKPRVVNKDRFEV